MNNILIEATYALTDRKRLTKNDLLCTVLGWRMVKLFEDSNKIKNLAPGFSIMSNYRGAGPKEGLVDRLLVGHHVQATHEIDEVIGLSSRDHATLHNEIRKIFVAKVSNRSEIDDIFSKFLQTYSKPLKTYTDFGGRLESYETALKEIALAVHDLISNKEFINELYNEALNNCRSKLTSLNSKSEKTNDISETFKEYENLWD